MRDIEAFLFDNRTAQSRNARTSNHSASKSHFTIAEESESAVQPRRAAASRLRHGRVARRTPRPMFVCAASREAAFTSGHTVHTDVRFRKIVALVD